MIGIERIANAASGIKALKLGHLEMATVEQFIEAVDSYIRWHNEKRIKIPLGSLSPIEYRVSFGLAT